MPTPAQVKDHVATLARDAHNLRELRASEGWTRLLDHLSKMEEQATSHILAEGESIHLVNYWRGYLKAVGDLKHGPDRLVEWAEQSIAQTA